MDLGFWRCTIPRRERDRTRITFILWNRRLDRGIPVARTFRGIGNQIHAAGRKRMAPRKAPHGEPRAATRAVELYGIGGVLRTGRVELAGAWHQSGKKHLIHAYRRQKYALGRAQTFGPMFRSRRTSSASRGAKGASATERRG